MKLPATLLCLLGFSLAAANPVPAPRLLDIANAHWAPATLSNSVLVIVDAQQEYAEGRLPLPGVHAATAEIARLLLRARAAGTPVIHIVQQARAPGAPLFDPAGAQIEIMPSLKPQDGEPVLIKHLPNSFTGTELAAVLRTTGRKHVIVVGFMTHMCVSTTARATLDQGFSCTLVANGCATRDLPDGMGGTIPAQTVHNVELAALADRFAEVVPGADDIAD
ncbi:MAG: cysteine hydrolase [Opitutaceae bacterium]|jgi:nicotinamidase-related amidase|nr:cysteine hydrolase [Opitutaceae bacterium]MBP8961797.1 cysteine hydrolase [Opitutaceae bacterium]